MLVRGFYNFCKRICSSGGFGYIGTDGNVYGAGTGYYINNIIASNIQQTLSYNCILQLGNGTTKETFYDYCLESPIDDSLFSNQTAVYSNYVNEPTNKCLLQVSHTVCNASDEPITVSEIGIILKDLLVTRTVLDEPVIIEPGKYATFTDVIEMPK